MEAHKPTILCVDDEDTPLLLRKLVLQKAGFDVLTANCAKEALRIAASNKIDLIVSDHLMPGVTGAELAKLLKTNHPSIPVILLSGVNEIPFGAEVADRFLSKVEGPDRLCATIREALTRDLSSREETGQ
jgi:CheY-like chemotaxis protein